MPHLDRLRFGLAASRSLPRPSATRALAAEQHRRTAFGIEQVEHRLARRFRPTRRSRCRPGPAVRPRSAAIARSIGRVSLTPSSSRISGTWSDGRSQPRHGSSTRCAGGLRRKAGRGPHMVEPAAAIARRPVLGAIAPPGEIAVRRGDERAAKIDPVMRRLQPAERLDLDRRMADDVEQCLVAPHVAFQRRDVEIADDQSRLSQLFRPARHALDEVQFLAEFRIDGAVGNVAARRDIDIFQPDAAIEPGADMARLAIVLPVVPAADRCSGTRDRMATPWCIFWPLSS